MCFEVVASVQPGGQPNNEESMPKNDDNDDDDDLGIMDVDDNKKTGNILWVFNVRFSQMDDSPNYQCCRKTSNGSSGIK